MLSLAWPHASYGQRVGVVLSGGASKGLAHIGVLRALEEQGIPIDYIAGTSMGAIIAGLYAAGYTTEEMQAIFESDEVELWMSDKIDNKYTYYFKKSNPNTSWLKINFDLDSTIFNPTLPTNLIAPRQMDLAFLEIMGAADVACHYNFDSLMVPFRCNATDISNHREVVFRNGHLKDAVRASMTFPFLFKPIVMDSCILFDGGMKDNFPLHIMKDEFQPDYVIGVMVSDLFSEKPNEESIVSIVESMIATPSDNALQLPTKGIILYPPIMPNLGLTDFKKGISLIDTGYQYTMGLIDSIRKEVTRSVSPSEVYQKRTAFKNKVPDLRIGEVKINGLKPYQVMFIKPIILRDKDVISFKTFKKNYSKLLMEDKIERIYPQMYYDSLRHFYQVQLDMTKRKPFTFKFGGYISTGTYSTLYLQLLYQLLDLQSVSFSLDGYIGSYYNAAVFSTRLDYYQQPPFYQLIKFGSQRWNYFNTNLRWIQEENTSYLVQNDMFFEYDIAFPAGRNSKWMTGVTIFNVTDKYYHNANISQNDISDVNRFHGIRPYMLYEYNSTDWAYYPTEGMRIRGYFSYQNGIEVNTPGSTSTETARTNHSRDWFSSNATFIKMMKMSDIFCFGMYGQLAISNQPVFSTFIATNLRSNTFAPTPESNINYIPQFRNPNFTAIGLNNVFLIKKQVQIRLDAYYYQPILRVVETNTDLGEQKKIVLDEFYLLTYAALIYPTRFGPLSVSFSMYPQSGYKKWETLFNISFGHLLFEHKIY